MCALALLFFIVAVEGSIVLGQRLETGQTTFAKCSISSAYIGVGPRISTVVRVVVLAAAVVDRKIFPTGAVPPARVVTPFRGATITPVVARPILRVLPVDIPSRDWPLSRLLFRRTDCFRPSFMTRSLPRLLASGPSNDYDRCEHLGYHSPVEVDPTPPRSSACRRSASPSPRTYPIMIGARGRTVFTVNNQIYFNRLPLNAYSCE